MGAGLGRGVPLVKILGKWVDRVKSGRLAGMLARILGKLVRALDSGMVRVLEKGRSRL